MRTLLDFVIGAGYRDLAPELSFPLVVHVDSEGRLTLLHQVVVMWRNGVPDNPDTTFALEPCVEDSGTQLARLQEDVDRIAEHLAAEFDDQARKLMRADA